ncbi:MAG TPA: glycosyl transferase [Rhodospirillaceae bacterium]|nr:glycosyl transferase [Rhodospirillaceae bacterium]HAT35360.1 glycosyl transferase [Rhodospirillaceae bacterium]
MISDAPLKVGVLVDLERGPRAGGHVKCWERFAEASVDLGENLDLTVHFQGRQEETISLGPQTRLVTLKPVFSTERLFFLRNIADYTDLAPGHPRLKHYLRNYDVLHTTDGYFAYAQSAARFSKKHSVPLVSSLHTNTPGFTRVYSERAIRRAFGESAAARLLVDRLRLPDKFSRDMEKKLQKHLAQCRAVLASEDDALAAHVPAGVPTTQLRRGIDKSLFHPDKRDPAGLRAQFHIPEDRPVIAFVGRLDGSKNVMTLAHAAKLMLEHGKDPHLVLAGKGYYRDEIKDLLGANVSFAGTLEAEEVARLNASSDLFVFPSTLEVWPNAVLEAKACGTPVVVAPGGGGIYIRTPGEDGLVIEDQSPTSWADTIEALLEDSDRLASLGRAARQDVEQNRLSWADVLRQDLLPIWRLASNEIVSANNG